MHKYNLVEHANGLHHSNGVSGPPLYRSPRHNTVITEKTVDDLHLIKRAGENHFSLENWQQALDSRDSNRRTLPDDLNAVHIVDGSDTRYGLSKFSKVDLLSDWLAIIEWAESPGKPSTLIEFLSI